MRRGSFFIVVGLGLATNTARAQDRLSVSLGSQASSIANQLGLSVSELEDVIESQVGALYGVSNINEFLRLSANAQGMVSKGIGVDYGSNPDGFILGFAVSGAIDAGNADIQDVRDAGLELANFERAVPIGIGAQFSLMIGYNFKKVGVPGLTLFLNGLLFPLDVDEYSGDFRNFGFHAQYKFFGPRGNKAAGWGGLDLTTGIEFSQMILDLGTRTLNTRTDLPGAGGTSSTLSTAATGDLKLTQTGWVVPLELTSNVNFLYVLSLYGGAALDFQFGSAQLEADLSAPLTATSPDSGQEQDLGTATIVADDSSGASPVLVRFLAGLQLNLGPIHIFGQFNLLTEDLTVSAAGGLRAIF